jgi:heterotetrameric sarcosine oxidase gamma subunit
VPEDPVARGVILPAGGEMQVEGWLVSDRPADGSFVLWDASPLTKVLVREGAAGTLDNIVATEPGHARWEGDELVTCVAPGAWSVFGPPGARAASVAAWDERVRERGGHVVDLTHARGALRLRGPHVDDLLARLCAVDVGAREPLSALRTHVAGVVTDIVVLDEPMRSLLVHFDRSYGAYLAMTLLERGGDLGLEHVRPEPWRS